MEKNKRYSTSLFVILCLLLNLSGECLAQWLKLPIWMDSFGTIAATYVLGPVCGVIVGVTLNTLYSIIYSWTYICYAVVSALIAVIAGVCIKKDYMKTLLGALTASFYIAFVSCVVSVIFNYIYISRILYADANPICRRLSAHLFQWHTSNCMPSYKARSQHRLRI